jgi:cyclic dehypoxanthinyl futalosine synthase
LKVDHPTGVAEYLRTQAIARIFLDNIENVQSSWVTQGPEIGQIALRYGANDFGSVMMEENVVSSSGTTFRLDAQQIESLIRDAGYQPRRRNNWYELLN